MTFTRSVTCRSSAPEGVADGEAMDICADADVGPASGMSAAHAAAGAEDAAALPARHDVECIRAIGLEAPVHRRLMLNGMAVAPELRLACLRALAERRTLNGVWGGEGLEVRRQCAGAFFTAAAAAAAATAADPEGDVATADYRMRQGLLHSAVSGVLEHTPGWLAAALSPPEALPAEELNDPRAQDRYARNWVKKAWQRVNAAASAVAFTLPHSVRLALQHLQLRGNAGARGDGTPAGLAALATAVCNVVVCLPGAGAQDGAAAWEVRKKVTAACCLSLPVLVDEAMELAAHQAIKRCCGKGQQPGRLLARSLQPGAPSALALLTAAHAAVYAPDAAGKAGAQEALRAAAEQAVGAGQSRR